ncbi:MAG: hypothetical protein PWQ37_2239 [Candidatus Petromonas sp.]|jgi:hypothetical protein|nr:hypothetical protein [Candidatus Petromonas sp.]
MKNLMMRTHIHSMLVKERVKEVLQSNKGEGFIDTAVKILISVVIGALLLAGLYMLFQDTILPTLEQRIKDMFDYQG